MWIQATALVLFAGLAYLMVAVYARGFGKAAEAVEQIDASGQVITPGPPGTPTRAQVKQLLDALHAVHAGGLQWQRLMLAGTAPIDSPGGRIAESTVVRVQFSREKLDR